MTLSVTYNYLSWFTTLYFIASYIRFYGLPNNNSVRFWGWITLAIFILSCLSIVTPVFIGLKANYFFVVDSNHLFALLLAVSSFMLFKNIKIGYSKWINAVGATTFGVFLIHTRGDVMRQWLWYDIVDCGGHYSDTLWWLYPIVIVITIFSICSLIDRIRIISLEKWCFNFIDPLLDKVKKSENKN